MKQQQEMKFRIINVGEMMLRISQLLDQPAECQQYDTHPRRQQPAVLQHRSRNRLCSAGLFKTQTSTVSQHLQGWQGGDMRSAGGVLCPLLLPPTACSCTLCAGRCPGLRAAQEQLRSVLVPLGVWWCKVTVRGER